MYNTLVTSRDISPLKPMMVRRELNKSFDIPSQQKQRSRSPPLLLPNPSLVLSPHNATIRSIKSCTAADLNNKTIISNNITQIPQANHFSSQSTLKQRSLTKDQVFLEQQKTLNEFRVQQQVSQQKLAKLNQTIENRNIEIFNLKINLKALESQLGETRHGYQQIENENGKYMERIKLENFQMHSQNSILQQQIEELKSENKIWIDNYENLEVQSKQLQENIRQQLEELKMENRELKIQNKENQNNIANVSAQKKNFEIKNNNLSQQQVDDHYQIQNLHNQVISLSHFQEENQSLKLIIEDLKVQLKAQGQHKLTTNDINFYEEEIKNLRVKNKEQFDQLQFLDAQRKQYQQNVRGLKQENQYLKEQSNELNVCVNKLKKYEENMQFLQQENQRMNKILVGRCRDFNF